MKVVKIDSKITISLTLIKIGETDIGDHFSELAKRMNYLGLNQRGPLLTSRGLRPVVLPRAGYRIRQGNRGCSQGCKNIFNSENFQQIINETYKASSVNLFLA